MAVTTGTLIAAGVSAVGSYAANKSKQKSEQRAMEQQMAMSKEESERAMQRTSHAAAIEDYYNRRDRYEASRGLDEFRKFSTVQDFAPGYLDGSPRVEQPVMPQATDYVASVDQPQANTGGGGGGQSFVERVLDPLKIF